jgi:hypothetical protein
VKSMLLLRGGMGVQVMGLSDGVLLGWY